MKKLIIALVVVGLLPVAAMAQYPYGGTEVASWYWDGAAWEVSSDPTNPSPAALARCFASDPLDSSCNKNWEIPVKIHASIAQWIAWSMSGTRWDWYVRKPGNYAADCITATLKSNQNVLVDYHGFGPLWAEDTLKTVVDTIPIWYAVGDFPVGPPPKGDAAWVYCRDMNDPAEWDTVYDSYNLHNGIQFKLWNYIHVVNCNSACEYQDDAYISLILLCQKEWIDTLTGYFVP